MSDLEYSYVVQAFLLAYTAHSFCRTNNGLAGSAYQSRRIHYLVVACQYGDFTIAIGPLTRSLPISSRCRRAGELHSDTERCLWVPPVLRM
jgi:hypothetical protein